MRNFMNFNGLTDHIIRPPKFTYSIADLGPSIFDLNNKIYQRIDFSTLSQKKIKIQASLWRVKQASKVKDSLNKAQNTVLIYLHCNCGSRVQAMQFVHKSLQLGYTFVAFDSRGCGHSQGQYVSLGYHEIVDLEAIIKYINDKIFQEPNIILWGRSMGAVTSINYLAKNKFFSNRIKVAVLDSPFINLKQVICQTINKRVGAPKLLIDLFISYLDPIVNEKAGFKISQFDLRDQISKIKCPLILMASKSDGLVPFKHLQQIYDSHKGKKSIFYLNQSHTDQRSIQTVNKIFKGISRYFLQEKSLDQKLSNTISGVARVGDSVNMQSFRSSQFLDPQIKTQIKITNRNKKKITILNSKSYAKANNRNTQFFQQKSKYQDLSCHTEKKKKKLSLNHCKTDTKSSNTRPIQLFKPLQNKINLQNVIQNNHSLITLHKITLVSEQKSHKRGPSSLSQLNKENKVSKFTQSFSNSKQVKRNKRITTNILTNR